MGFSIYCTAKRDTPLTPIESQRIDAIAQSFDVIADLERYAHTGKGLNWESFTRYETRG